MSFVSIIKEKRPDLSDGSVKTYNSILTSLWKRVFKDQEVDVEKLHDVEKMNEYAETLKTSSTRKTFYACLFSVTGIKKYQDEMMKEQEKINLVTSEQVRNDKQEENYITQEQIKEKFNELETVVKKMYRSKVYDWAVIQDYILLALYGGMFIPPRRALDYTAMKIANFNIEEDNYFNKNKFVFNKFKTVGKVGSQIVELPKPLVSIVKKWISINPTDWFLFDTKMHPMDSVKLNQKMNRIFGKNVGINNFRHSFMSEKYADTIEVNRQMAEDFRMMGSSRRQEAVYVQSGK